MQKVADPDPALVRTSSYHEAVKSPPPAPEPAPAPAPEPEPEPEPAPKTQQQIEEEANARAEAEQEAAIARRKALKEEKLRQKREAEGKLIHFCRIVV